MGRYAKIVKCLCAIWLGAYLVFGVILSLTVGVNVEMDSLPLVTQVIIYCVNALLLYPLLWVIHHYAKLAQMKQLRTIVRIVLILFSFWILAGAISFLRN